MEATIGLPVIRQERVSLISMLNNIGEVAMPGSTIRWAREEHKDCERQGAHMTGLYKTLYYGGAVIAEAAKVAAEYIILSGRLFS